MTEVNSGRTTKWRGPAGFAVMLVMITCNFCDAGERKKMNAANTTPSDEWLQFRKDRTLTGRGRLKGNIKHPAVKWKHFAGARETLLEVWFNDGVAKTLALPTTDRNADQYNSVALKWGFGEPLYDLDGDGNLHAAPPDYYGTSLRKIGKFLPDQPGLQKLEFECGFYKGGTAADVSLPLFGQLTMRKAGRWEQAWQSQAIPLLYFPNVITGDFDNDGRLEVAVTPWYDLWMLDVTTGNLKAKCRFTPPGTESGRAYGWLGAFDLNGDGKQEFVIIAQFENSIEVLGWKDGQLQLIWHRILERGITRKNTVLRSGVNPVQDVDGDGRPEIVVSIFNAAGDDKWHVMAFNGLTGEVKLDVPDQYLTGLNDIDGDGVAELFCSRTVGYLIPPSSELSLLSFKHKTLATRWQCSNTAFQTHIVQELPANVNCDIASPRDTLLAGLVATNGISVFFTRKIADTATGEIELTIWQADPQGGIHRKGSLTGPHLQALATRTAHAKETNILVSARAPGHGIRPVKGWDITAQPLLSRRIGMPCSPAVIGRLTPQSPPTVVVQGACEIVEAFQLTGGNRPASVKWRVPGRGMLPTMLKHGSGAAVNGVLLADVGGDGSLTTIVATRGDGGYARLVAINPDGKELWHYDFPALPGKPPASTTIGGLILWFSGHFREATRCDVLVTIRRNTMHSEETMLLDGRTGGKIWHRTTGSASRACGGSWMAIYDHDGDSLDDALLLFPDGIFVMQGATGNPLLDLDTNNKVFSDVWAFYAAPLVADFLGNGQKQMLYGCSSYMLALLDLSGKVIWNAPPNNGTPAILPGIGDVDGDGKLELLSPGHRRAKESRAQDFHCYDAATGNLKWKLPLPGSCFGNNEQVFPDSPTSPAVADIDGDGKDECIFTIEKTLYAIGIGEDGKSGVVRWKLELPDNLGPAAIADADGDGAPEIIVVCEDGYVYGIGAEGRPE